ncbi:hypothetical protein [Massilia sp. PWRC2]|uniref:hypothetical protein n=1 Tax=Massilia sp. PWRC2 TaxID=2804626 RepID=UPI003CEB5516
MTDQYSAARMAAVQEMAHLARMIEPSEDSAIIGQAARVFDAIRAMPAPVAGSVGDDAIACSSCGLTMGQSRYLDSRPTSSQPAR